MCDGDDDDSGSWIGLEPADFSQVTQIGFIKHVIATNTAQVCRFYASGGGIPSSYNCGVDANSTTVWFRVSEVGSVSGLTINAYDCGTGGGYSSCTLKLVDAGYTPSVGYFNGETTHACQTYMLGSAATPTLFGNATYPVEEQNAVGGSWASHTIYPSWADGLHPPCTFYGYSYSDTQIQVWDSRN